MSKLYFTYKYIIIMSIMYTIDGKVERLIFWIISIQSCRPGNHSYRVNPSVANGTPKDIIHVSLSIGVLLIYGSEVIR